MKYIKTKEGIFQNPLSKVVKMKRIQIKKEHFRSIKNIKK